MMTFSGVITAAGAYHLFICSTVAAILTGGRLMGFKPQTQKSAEFTINLLIAIVEVLVSKGVKNAAAVSIAREIVNLFCGRFGGGQTYVPRKELDELCSKAAIIFQEFTSGASCADIATKLGYTEQWVRQILRRVKPQKAETASLSIVNCKFMENIKGFQEIEKVIGKDSAKLLFEKLSGRRIYIPASGNGNVAELIIETIGDARAKALFEAFPRRFFYFPSVKSFRTLLKHKEIVEGYQGQNLSEYAMDCGVTYVWLVQILKRYGKI
jgi:Mor family transcriptional regulator